MAEQRIITRQQLAKFLPDQETIRAFEALLKAVAAGIPADLAALEAEVAAAAALAGVADAAADAAQATADAALAAAAKSVAVTVDFGASFTDKAQTVVTGQAWVAAGSEIIGQVLAPAGTDPDEMRLLEVRVVISDIVAGVGFTVTAYSETEAQGVYTVACIGV